MKTMKMTALVCLLAAAALPCRAQVMAVVDAGVLSMLSGTKAEQVLYFGQSIAEQIKNAQNTFNQFQNMLRAEQRALNNLKGIADVSSFDDFMSWQNRQLYLERGAEERFKNMGVKIGNTTYRLQDVDKIPEALRESYGDFFEKDFSEQQRKEMWTRLGLSPGSYVYLQTWQAREKALAEIILAGKDNINAENMNAFEYFKSVADKYAADAKRPEDKKIQEKEILMDLQMTAMDTNRTLRNLSYDMALKNELELARQKQELTPPAPPRLSDTYHYSPFGPITEE